jgi:hypothetical protein
VSTTTGIGKALECDSEDETFCELPDESFPLLLVPLLDPILSTVVLLHLDFSSTIGGLRLLPLGLSSDLVVLMEREARDPSRERDKSRKDVTPSDSPEELEGGIAEFGGMDKGVNRNRILEVPGTIMGTGGLVLSSGFGGSTLPNDFSDGLRLELDVDKCPEEL